MLKIGLVKTIGLTICFNINYFKSSLTKVNFKKENCINTALELLSSLCHSASHNLNINISLKKVELVRKLILQNSGNELKVNSFHWVIKWS